MTKSRQYCKCESQPAESADGRHKQPKKEAQPMSQNLVLLILSALTPICLTVCVLAMGMNEGKVMVNLSLKVASYFELQTGITKTLK